MTTHPPHHDSNNNNNNNINKKLRSENKRCYFFNIVVVCSCLSQDLNLPKANASVISCRKKTGIQVVIDSLKAKKNFVAHRISIMFFCGAPT